MEVALITAFRPFSGMASNASEAVAREAARILRGQGIAATVEVLPVVRAEIASAFDAAVAAHSPRAVLALGLAQRATAVRVERTARNRLDFAVPDEAGEQVRDEAIVPSAPDRALPGDAAALLRALLPHAPAELSDDAGTFICNLLAFHAYGTCSACGLPVAFLHVPPLPGDIGSDGAVATGLPLEASARAVAGAMRVLLP